MKLSLFFGSLVRQRSMLITTSNATNYIYVAGFESANIGFLVYFSPSSLFVYFAFQILCGAKCDTCFPNILLLGNDANKLFSFYYSFEI